MGARTFSVKLLLDEHYSGLIAERLRGAGHDVLTVADLGLRGLADEPLQVIQAKEEISSSARIAPTAGDRRARRRL